MTLPVPKPRWFDLWTLRRLQSRHIRGATSLSGSRNRSWPRHSQCPACAPPCWVLALKAKKHNTYMARYRPKEQMLANESERIVKTTACFICLFSCPASVGTSKGTRSSAVRSVDSVNSQSILCARTLQLRVYIFCSIPSFNSHSFYSNTDEWMQANNGEAVWT